MIERERTDERELTGHRLALEARRHPGFGGQQIGDERLVKQHRAFGNARGAAGILQHDDVIRLERRPVECLPAPRCNRRIKARRARQVVSRHHLLHVAHHLIDDGSFCEAEQVAHARHNDVLDRCHGNHVLQRLGEVLQNDDCLGARIPKLVFELARRVERIDVDGDEATAQHCRNGNGILEHVRHHDGHAIAAHESKTLQPCGQSFRQLIEPAVGQTAAHADIGWGVAIFCKTLF